MAKLIDNQGNVYADDLSIGVCRLMLQALPGHSIQYTEQEAAEYENTDLEALCNAAESSYGSARVYRVFVVRADRTQASCTVKARSVHQAEAQASAIYPDSISVDAYIPTSRSA